MSGVPLLRVERLNAFFGRAQALFDVSLGVAAGEVLALVGRNGAGKSTTMKAIAGLVAAHGTIALAGQRLDGLAPHRRAGLGLGYVPEERRVFTELTVRENLVVGARSSAPDLAPLLALFPNLAEILDRSAAQMSGGEQQMLAVARTLAARPRVVLLDEPSEGIAPKIVRALAEAVLAMKAQGVAVLLSEQNLRFAGRVADRAMLMEHGHIIGTATRDELSMPSDAVKGVLGL